MKKLTLALVFAASSSFTGSALAEKHSGNPLTCSISCNQGYSQCISTGIDWSIVKTPGEASSRTASNISTAAGCREEAAQCYKDCRG